MGGGPLRAAQTSVAMLWPLCASRGMMSFEETRVKAHVGPVSRLMDELAKLPGVGRKSAERMAYHILRAPRGDAQALADAVREVRAGVRQCGICGSFAVGVAP